MKSTSRPNWQKRRSAINHDWLKNWYLQSLDKFLNLLNGRVKDNQFEASFVQNILTEWEINRDKIIKLAQDLESEMSPKRLFEYAPLSKCDEETKRWLGDLVHFLWLARYPVKTWMSESCEATRKADDAYGKLMKALEGCENVQSADALKPFLKLFQEFRTKCQSVAKSIEKFPSEIKVS